MLAVMWCYLSVASRKRKQRLLCLRFAAARSVVHKVGLEGAFTAFVKARPRSSLGQALRAKRFRQFVRLQAGSHRSTGSHRGATECLEKRCEAPRNREVVEGVARAASAVA
jgi:hypothetical protein